MKNPILSDKFLQEKINVERREMGNSIRLEKFFILDNKNTAFFVADYLN